MDEFLQMDIFFAVTTAAVIILTVLVSVVLIRVFRILRTVEEISKMVSEEGKELRSDIAHARAELAQKGLIMGTLVSVSRLFTRRPRKSKEDSR